MNRFFDFPVTGINGEPDLLGPLRGRVVLAVNVASRCGYTPQYLGLERLHGELAEAGFSVVGFPCNQFLEQEPGTAEEIQTFCSTKYGVSFPMMDKIEVNGPGRHPLYAELTKVPVAGGKPGDISWNFEKFVISADGARVTRFAPQTKPDAPEVLAAIEAALPEA